MSDFERLTRNLKHRLEGCRGASPAVGVIYYIAAISRLCRWGGGDGTVFRTPAVVFRTLVPVTGLVAHVNPPVTVRAHVAITKLGTHHGRTGQLTSAALHTAFL